MTQRDPADSTSQPADMTNEEPQQTPEPVTPPELPGAEELREAVSSRVDHLKPSGESVRQDAVAGLTVSIEPVSEGSLTGSAAAVCMAGANFATAISFSASAL